MLCPVAMRCAVRDPKPGDLVKLLRERPGAPRGSIGLVIRCFATEVVQVRLCGPGASGIRICRYLKDQVEIL